MHPRVYSRVTAGVRVNVRSSFVPEHSQPVNHRYVFAYEIEIVNESDTTIQLLSREWHIIHADRHHQIVKGEGVVGQQPIIIPGESYRYTSGVQLRTEIGQMYGFYNLNKLRENFLFAAEIPPFTLECSWRWN